MITLYRPIIIGLNRKINKKKTLIICNSNANEKKNIEKHTIEKYKELNDPEYFRDDFYGLKKIFAPVNKKQSIQPQINVISDITKELIIEEQQTTKEQ